MIFLYIGFPQGLKYGSQMATMSAIHNGFYVVKTYYHKPLVLLMTLSQFKGTPKRITLSNPLSTRGWRKPSSLLTPHLCCPGNEGISTLASGSSVIKIGYMNIDFVTVNSVLASHFRGVGRWYPPWITELVEYVIRHWKTKKSVAYETIFSHL